LHYCDLARLDPFGTLERATGNYASELVAPEGLGPDLIARVTLNEHEPHKAVEIARHQYADVMGTPDLG
jgi:hypothetical protein